MNFALIKKLTCRQDWLLPLLFAIALTPVALIAHQYKFVNDDQILYIPFLYKTINSFLFPADYFFNQPQSQLSLFEDLLTVPVQLWGLDWTMAGGYFLAQIAILLGIYYLAQPITSAKGAYLAMILFILPVSIGGTFVRTYDNYLNPRTLTLPLLLFTLAMIYRRNMRAAVILATIHLLLHPLSGLYSWFITAFSLGWWISHKQLSIKQGIWFLSILLASLGVLAFKSIGGGGGTVYLDPAWREIIQTRTPYVFLSSWKLTDWAMMGLYLVWGITGWYIRPRNSRTTQLFVLIISLVVGLTLITALAADGMGLALIAQLQLARSWLLVIIMAIILGADTIVFLYQKQGWGYWLIAVLLSGVLYFNRGKPDWLPIWLILLGIVFIARFTGQTIAKTRAANLLCGLAGICLIMPSLLTTWPATEPLTTLLATANWQLPPEGLYPTLIFFAAVVISKLSVPAQPWFKPITVSLASLLVITGIFFTLNLLPQPDLPAYLALRLQLPTHHSWMSAQFSAWVKVQQWANTHTPVTARFLTNPEEKGFRVFSQRMPLVEEKDGAAVMFNRSYALEWQNRMQSVIENRLINTSTQPIWLSQQNLQNLQKIYPFEYVIWDRSVSFELPQVYSNQFYTVYVWPQ